jgi:hypothetical protein
MGFFFRRRKSFGPFALNFSTRGIGISTGVKGARLSVGPNGTFVHLGRQGFYYRKKIGGFSERSNQRYVEEQQVEILTGTKIESADIKNFQNSSSDSLLNEIKEKNSLTKYSLISLIASIIIFFIAVSSGAPAWLNIIIIIASILLYSYLFKKDVERKTVTVMYELDKDIKKPVEEMNKGFEELEKSEKLWRIETQQATDDWKRNSGASNLVNRKGLTIDKELPSFFDSNITPYSFKIDDKRYYFFPDRILIYQGKDVGMAKYHELIVNTTTTQFIEDEGVASDSEVIGHNWKYMNKSGGPDRRFNNNYQIPVVLYSVIDIQTKSGINIRLQCSNKETGSKFLHYLQNMIKLKETK